jgi:transcriptional regulator with GAF, ATPase, and Fis domain
MITHDLIGSCRRFQSVLDGIETVAPVECTVLLSGETGTGKEVVARAIHNSSTRRHNRFVALNCAAIPSALLESELFGHERGAFTGAIARTIGRFQAADKGTLFLDEIGDLPLELQPKLLRVLQEQEFERLGSGQTQHVDVRIIAATNQDLLLLVRESRFRADLYYRLNVFPLALPPLRDRREDIPLLVDHFVKTFAERHRKQIEHVPESLVEALTNYDWPGNIRELQNFIERSVIISIGTTLRSLAGELAPSTQHKSSGETLMEAERVHIIAALEVTGWVVGGRNGAAARLGLPRTTLIAKMQKLGISRTPSHSHGAKLYKFPANGDGSAEAKEVAESVSAPRSHAFAGSCA